MATVKFFAQAIDVAGCRRADVGGETLGEVLEAAVERFGGGLAEVIAFSTVWLNGSVAGRDAAVCPEDEIAVLPPVSGG